MEAVMVARLLVFVTVLGVCGLSRLMSGPPNEPAFAFTASSTASEATGR
jgi:hypothetical protein